MPTTLLAYLSPAPSQLTLKHAAALMIELRQCHMVLQSADKPLKSVQCVQLVV